MLSKDRLISLGSQVYLNLALKLYDKHMYFYLEKFQSKNQIEMDVNIIHIIRWKSIARIVLHHTSMSHSL